LQKHFCNNFVAIYFCGQKKQLQQPNKATAEILRFCPTGSGGVFVGAAWLTVNGRNGEEKFAGGSNVYTCKGVSI